MHTSPCPSILLTPSRLFCGGLTFALLVIGAPTALAQPLMPIDASRFPIRGIRGGDDVEATKVILASTFQRARCANGKCEGVSVDVDSEKRKTRSESFVAYANELNQLSQITYKATYRIGNSESDCVPRLDATRAEMLALYGAPRSIAQPRSPGSKSEFGADWGATGLPKNLTPQVLQEYFLVDLKCSHDGELNIETTFVSNTIASRKKDRAPTSAAPKF